MVDKWLDREKGWIAPRDLEHFSEMLAMDLYLKRESRGAERLPPKELPRVIAEYAAGLDSTTVRRRSLLNRDARGNLKFSHRSIMEYLFVRRFICLPSASRPSTSWTDLMKIFSTEMIKAHSTARMLEKEQLQLLSADLAGVVLQFTDVQDICLDHARLQKGNFRGTCFTRCSFWGADLRGADFSDCEFTDVEFSGADLRDADLTNTIQTRVTLSRALLAGAVISGRAVAETARANGSGASSREIDVAIHLGTNRTSIMLANKGLVLDEPSVVSLDRATGAVSGFGRHAELMRNTAGHVLMPVLGRGVVSDTEITTKMIRYFLAQVHGSRYKTIPSCIAAVTAGATKVHLRAIHEAIRNARISEVVLVEKGIAAAIGAGLNVFDEFATLVVDIGAATTDVTVVSRSASIHSSSIVIGGNEMNDAIKEYLWRKYVLRINSVTAEALKQEIGSACPLDVPLMAEVKGDASGVRKTLTVDDWEIREALSACVDSIVNLIRDAFGNLSQEDLADIAARGIMLTGGGSLLKGLDARISKRNGMASPYCRRPTIRGDTWSCSDHVRCNSSQATG
jgi:rod shape-determining protein MreB